MGATTAAEEREFNIQLGERIRQIRILGGQTQVGLSKLVGVSYQQINKYEKGLDGLSAAKLRKLATALQVPVSELLAPAAEPINVSRAELDMVRAFNRLSVKQKSAVNAVIALMVPDTGG